MALDYISPDTGTSLRTLMMGIKSKEKPLLSLFHSVDVHWHGNGHVVTFLLRFEAEAWMILSGLLIYLSFYHPDQAKVIAMYFTAAAMECTIDQKWDPVQYCIMTPDDEVVDDLLEVDAEFDLLDPNAENHTTDANVNCTASATTQLT